MFFGYRSDNLLLLLYAILAIRWFGFSFGRSRGDRLPHRRELQVQTEHTIMPFHSWWRDYFSSNETYQEIQAQYGQSISLSDESDMPGNNESLTSCIPQPNQPLAKVRIRVHADDVDQLEVDGKNKSKIKRAVCEFICHGRQVHFPHAMQQLYRCYSLWMDHPQAKAILLVSDEEIQRQLYSKAFTKGILPIFHVQMNMSTILKDSLPQEKLNEYMTSSKKNAFGEYNSEPNYDIKHVTALHDMTQRQLELNDTSSISCNQDKPRIGFLNRNKEHGRSILNAEELAILPEIQELSRNNTVEVKYFDGLEFKDQVAFFRSVDILFSPHGAQLTAVAFMNSPCGHVVELFPKGYKLGDYFGSLALRSHKEYSYLYMSANASSVDAAKNRKERIAARATNLCPSTAMMVDVMRQLVEGWKQCCERKRQESEAPIALSA